MLVSTAFHAVVSAAHHALDGFATGLTPIAGGAAGAVAIVCFTFAVRLLISPLTYAQVRGERRRSALAPRLAELRERHGEDPSRLLAETTALYRSAGASPLSGLLPGLLQAPFFMIMYSVVRASQATGALGGRLFGVPLTAHLGDGLSGAAGPVFGVLLATLAALAWWSSRRLRRAAGAGPAPGAAGDVIARLTTLLPFVVVLMAAVLPLATGVYLVATTAWTAGERALWRRTPITHS